MPSAPSYTGAEPSTGHGTFMIFATSGFVARMTSIGGHTQNREALDSSHLLTDTYRTKVPGDLIDPGEFSIEFFSDMENVQPPISAVPETITIYMPFSSTGIPIGESESGNLSVAEVAADNSFMREVATADMVSETLMRSTGIVVWGEGPAYTPEDNDPGS